MKNSDLRDKSKSLWKKKNFYLYKMNNKNTYNQRIKERLQKKYYGSNKGK